MISASIREARQRRNLSRSKLAPLLGITEAVYARYEGSVSACRRPPDPSLRGAWSKSGRAFSAGSSPSVGENQTKVDLLLACLDKLRAFDDETLRDVFSLLNRLGKSGHRGNGTATAAPFLARAAEPLKRMNGHGET